MIHLPVLSVLLSILWGTTSSMGVVKAFAPGGGPTTSIFPYPSEAQLAVFSVTPQIIGTSTNSNGSIQPFDYTHRAQATVLYMSVSDETESKGTNLPFFLDPGTKGGVLVLMTVIFVLTWAGYQFLVSALGYDEIDAGIGVGMGFTVLSTLAWMSTYLFRVATKDMTYVSSPPTWSDSVMKGPFLARFSNWKLVITQLIITTIPFQAKQLKDYENAVIAKRLEELDDDEVQALVEEVEKDSFWNRTQQD
jgi:Protein of unknown function (DUF3007)